MWTSVLAILMAKFPGHKSSIIAWTELFFNLGLTVGPVIGAFLYDSYGFFLPFIISGSAMLLSGAIALFTNDVCIVSIHFIVVF